jgi:hypothetical protein
VSLLQGLRSKFGMNFSFLPCMLHIPHLSHSLRFCHSNNIWRRAKVLELLIMKFWPPSCCFFSLSWKCAPFHFVSKAVKLYFSWGLKSETVPNWTWKRRPFNKLTQLIPNTSQLAEARAEVYVKIKLLFISVIWSCSWYHYQKAL